MDKRNKIKAKISLLFTLNTFLLGTSIVYGETVTVTKTNDLSSIFHKDEPSVELTHLKNRANIKDTFVEDFLQKQRLKKGQELTLGETIGQGASGTIYKAEQDDQAYIIKQAVDKDATRGIQNEYKRSLAMYSAAYDFVWDPDTENVYGKLSGLGVIVPVIGETQDGSIVQAYANGVNLKESATYGTKDFLVSKIYSSLCDILQDSVRKSKDWKEEWETRKTLDNHTTWTQNLSNDLFNKSIGKLQTDTETLVKRHLLTDVSVQALVDSQKLDIDFNQIEILIKHIQKLHKHGRLDFFNEHGFPHNPQRAIRVLCSFFHALVTLHELGFVHCDIKPANVILTRDKIGQADNTVLKLIDLGSLTRIGDEIGSYSRNGAPEFLHHKGIYDSRILTVQPSYDIYCTVGIILGCLFGYSGLQADDDNFWPQPGKDPLYIQHLKDPNFRNEIDSRRFDFFSDMLQNLNNTMGQYGDNYPEEVLNVIQTILSLVTEADRQLRPSAIDILERLQELALSDWSSGNFQIQVSENQVSQKVKFSVSKK